MRRKRRRQARPRVQKNQGQHRPVRSAPSKRQFLRFLIAGGVAAGANFGSRFIFSLYVSYELAIVLAYLVGMTVAFLLMRGRVFSASTGRLMPQVLKFTLVNGFAVLQTVVISLLLARYVFPPFGVQGAVGEAWAHAVGVIVPVFSSYFGHKLLTFR